MQKEFEKQEKLRSLDEEHRKNYEEELKKQQALHNDHEKVHHPGSKAQLEEVWEKKDHMDKDDFNPVTFFMTHGESQSREVTWIDCERSVFIADLDNNGQLDEQELEAIFTTDLDKVYQPGHSEDDMREREEERKRMREHVMREVDTNGDRMVSMAELLAQTKREEFNQDQGWETVDQQPQFTHEEYIEFERRRQAEIQQLIAQGRVSVPSFLSISNLEIIKFHFISQLPPHANMPNGHYPNGYGAYPNQIPQQGYQQQPPHYQHPQQVHNQQNQQYHQQQQQYHQQQQQQYQQHQQQQYQQQQYQQQYHNQQQQPAPVQYAQPVPPSQHQQPNIPQQAPVQQQPPQASGAASQNAPIPPQQQVQPQAPQQVSQQAPGQDPQQVPPQVAVPNSIHADPSAKH